MDGDGDGLVWQPPLAHERDDLAGRVVGLVTVQRGVEEDRRGRERSLCAVEAAGGQQNAGVGQLEKVGAEEPPRGGGRVDGLERARDGVVDLGARYELPAARAAGNQHLAVVEKLHAEMTAPCRSHRRREQREGVRAGVVDFG